MAKKTDMDLVISNALIYLNRDYVTRNQIYHYINIVDSLITEGYYTYGDDDAFDNFCGRYHFLVKQLGFGNTLKVIGEKNILQRYFLLVYRKNKSF